MKTALALLLTLAAPVAAQDRTPSHCIALSQAAPGLEYIHLAGFRDSVPDETVRIRHIDHSMFLIQTSGGLSVVTDFNGWIGTADFTPDIVTMNNAHSGHFTASPDPAITHPLQGWPTAGLAADHDLDLGEMLVRNVTSDMRSRGVGVIPDGNSIFVFEVAGLCIGHLGHLHQEPTGAQYAALGRMDVVMAAADGGLTVDHSTMIRILNRLRSSVVIPMHWSGRHGSLEAFLRGMVNDFDIRRDGVSEVEVSLRTLPDRPTVIVLEPAPLRDDG